MLFFHKHTSIILTSAMVMGFLPMSAVAQTAEAPLGSGVEPYEQEFTLTAYYSPLPDQCCYVKGSYEADKILNGEGTHGADGTPVYEGMIAAPSSYPFGTRVVLPGLGTFTVHDRGGAIQEWDDTHRLDVWAGHGEEGLARALAFGVQHIRGTVYLPGNTSAPAENFSLDALPAPDETLQPYVVANTPVSSLHAAADQRGYSVRLLQGNLAVLGYFDHDITGVFGDVTTVSLQTFLKDMKLEEPSDHVSKKAAAWLQAAISVNREQSPIMFVGKESNAPSIRSAQRTLRYFGYYRGRTDGEYSSILFNSILAYQRDQQLVGNATSPGAGRIGPMTKGVLDKEILRHRIARAADRIIVMEKISDMLDEKGVMLAATMSTGSNGKSVKMLQEFLADAGLFPSEKINGNYGELTAQAVAQYQVTRGVLGTDYEKGSGTIGPVTLHTIRSEQAKKALMVVRAEGWEAL